MSSSTPTDAVTPLIERMNHLESLLVSNLLGFLLTTTITIFGAAYELRPGAKTPPFVSPAQIFVGASVLYVFLSGYYYYMLAQFYACVITLIPFVKSLGVKISPLWRTLRIPSFGVIPERIANITMLANAPLLPIAFSTLSLVALRFVIEGHGVQNIGVVPTTIGISLQVLTCILVITQPFLSFIKVTTEVSNEPGPTLIQEPCREAESESQTGSAPSVSEAPSAAFPTSTQTE
jgi:hypothetical protein